MKKLLLLLLFFLSLENGALMAQSLRDMVSFLGQKAYEENKERDYYKFGDRGDLVSFRVSFQDGSVLEANQMEESKGNEFGIPWQTVRTFPSGVKVTLEGEFYSDGPTNRGWYNIDKVSDIYELFNKSIVNSYWDRSELVSSLSKIKSYDNSYGFLIELPGGISISYPIEESLNDGITISDMNGNSVKLNTNYIDLDFGEYRAITTSRFVADTIRYSDGRRFEGKVKIESQEDIEKVHPLYKMAVPFLQACVIPEYNRYLLESMVSAIYPENGILYDRSGTMIGEYVSRGDDVSQSVFYEATSDGKVSEVYIDGVAMAPGFERDKMISEYSGLLIKRAEELKEKEESSKRLAEYYQNKEREKKEKMERLYAQYGKSNVDSILKSKVPIGAPEGLLQHIPGFVSCDIVSTNSKRYKVKQYDVDSDDFETKIFIWTSNGKVTSVIYY